MKVLIFNHFFEMDIDAMLATRGEHEVRIFPFQAIRRKAAMVFTKKIVDGSFAEQKELKGTPAYYKWEKAMADLIAYLRKGFPFDVFVTPSDTFFYLREFIRQCKCAGIPVIVLQKETSISEYTMVHDAADVAKHFPFMSDLMLACGERQKQFWVNAGTDPERIKIIGQPRFDIYKNSALRSDRSIIPNSIHSKNILFLSYDLDAYSPDYSEVLQNTWGQLRSQTEQALADLAELGYNICIKPHPQQRGSNEAARLKEKFGDRWSKTAHWIDRLADTRYLILESDFIVGFQTTALFEAMLVGKHVIYTNWTDAVVKHRDQLIPFHEMGKALKVAKSAENLKQMVIGAIDDESILSKNERLDVSIPHTGAFNGHASTRAWEAIKCYCENHPNADMRDFKQSPAKMIQYAVKALWLGILYKLVSLSSPVISILANQLSKGTHNTPQDWQIKASRMRKSMQELSQFWLTSVKDRL